MLGCDGQIITFFVLIFAIYPKYEQIIDGYLELIMEGDEAGKVCSWAQF